VLCCVALRCVAGAVVQAGCHLLLCEAFWWSGLNSSSTKRMERQRSSSSLAGLGSDLALNGSFVRVRDECRSPECVAVAVEPVLPVLFLGGRASRASRLSDSRTLQNYSTRQLGAASAPSGQPNPGRSQSPQKVQAESANYEPHCLTSAASQQSAGGCGISRVRRIWVGCGCTLQHHLASSAWSQAVDEMRGRGRDTIQYTMRVCTVQSHCPTALSGTTVVLHGTVQSGSVHSKRSSVV
jgi:hypothetical protein